MVNSNKNHCLFIVLLPNSTCPSLFLTLLEHVREFRQFSTHDFRILTKYFDLNLLYQNPIFYQLLYYISNLNTPLNTPLFLFTLSNRKSKIESLKFHHNFFQRFPLQIGNETIFGGISHGK